MGMRRAVRVVLLMVLIVTTTAVRAEDEGACKLATKGESPVARACKTGGFRAAKKLMREMVDKAKKTQHGLNCDTCHEGVDDGRYDLLKKDGRSRFDALVVAQKK